MKVLRVRHRDVRLNVGFQLNRFITGWPSAQSKFISGIADAFHEWLPIGPQDFSVTPAFALEDLRCKCRLFDGECEIVLEPEALHLDFKNVQPGNRPVVLETVRRASEWLVAALGDRGRDGLSFQTHGHLEALEAGAADLYLGQFASAEAGELAKSEPGVKCLSSSRTVLSGEAEGWRLVRVVEKSASIENGVFVHTRIHVKYPDPSAPMGFDDQMRLLERAEKLADRVVGLDCEEA